MNNICPKHNLETYKDFQVWDKENLKWFDGCKTCYAEFHKFCQYCKHSTQREGCNKCLEFPRKKPSWELKTEELKTEQDIKQDKPKPAKPDKLKTNPKFKRKLEGFKL